ncbi:hypothetical protein [Nonomuraea indica]|uniref:Secreted protein n=1 Tax=Nonomuraea indica TaxID=1581193 RepID=A0ABW7ZXR1_9ACTN|nr:hypothetical protein [Nonomuraea indica]
MRTRLTAALLLLLHLLVPAAGHATHRGLAAQSALLPADQAMGHPRDERAPRVHLPTGPHASIGGVAVLPAAAGPAGRPRPVTAAPGGHSAPPQPGHAAAPARGPPSTTR